MKYVTMLALMIFCISTIHADAAKTTAELNKAFWPLQREMEEAGDDAYKVIEAYRKVYELFVGDATTENAESVAARYEENGDIVEIELLTPVIQRIAESYEKIGDKQNAHLFYKIWTPFGLAYQKMIIAPGGDAAFDDYNFMIKKMQSKAMANDVSIDLYTEVSPAVGNVPYKGGKFEPEMGIYYGRTFCEELDGTLKNSIVAALPKQESGQIIYVDYPNFTCSDFSWIFERSVKKYSILQVASNIIGEGDALKGILNNRAYFENEADYLNSISVPVLYRFGSEMNLWSSHPNPQEFIDAFRFVSDIMREKAPNVAMVFCVGSVNKAGVTYMDYYPGDEYVDWIGISTYASKYFLGDVNQSDDTQAIYHTGDYTNPVNDIRPVIEVFGDRKPIAICEFGVSNYFTTNNESLNDWAVPHLKSYLMYVPMNFPQIKAMFYFDSLMPETYHYNLFGNDELSRLYGDLTGTDIFLGKGAATPGFVFEKVGGQRVPADNVILNSYFTAIRIENPSVEYRIDGEWADITDTVPFRVSLDLSGLSDGKHNLSIRLLDGSNCLSERSLDVYKKGLFVYLSGEAPDGEVIAIKVNGNLLQTKDDPIIIEDRTFVPIRVVSQAMGFDVEWIDKENKVVITDGITTVSMEIGSQNAYKRVNQRTEEVIAMHNPPVIINDRTFVPFRFLAELFDAQVDWDANNSAVIVQT